MSSRRTLLLFAGIINVACAAINAAIGHPWWAAANAFVAGMCFGELWEVAVSAWRNRR